MEMVYNSTLGGKSTFSTASSLIVPGRMPKHDVILRIAVDETASSLSWVPTNKFVHYFSQIIAEKDRDISVLREAFLSQRRQIEYNAVYNAYLLGAIDDDQFDEDADAYIVELRSVNPAELEDKVRRLSDLVDVKFTSGDVATLFGVDEQDVSCLPLFAQE